MRFDIRKAKDGKFYFTQVADNGEVLDTSETYETKQGAVHGAAAAQGSGLGDAEIVDRTADAPEGEE